IFPIASKWVNFIGEGHFPDCDMLPIGRLLKCGGFGGERDSRLTEKEKEVMLTLWAMMRSPLMMGGHLPESKEEDLKFYKNREVIKINQDSTENRVITDSMKYPVWGAKVDGTEYVACFNVSKGIMPKFFNVEVKGAKAFDVWQGKELKIKHGKVRFSLTKNSCKLIRIIK
ncbi:MAG: hypothetical protein J6V83_02455, partial [Clostridia bacterium]|nr:hypothetical protein [Clostridia bacterium]